MLEALGMDQTFPLLYYSFIAQPFSASQFHDDYTYYLCDMARILISVPPHTSYFSSL
jgi:hypothetical protein